MLAGVAAHCHKLKPTEGNLNSITSFPAAAGLQTIEKSCLQRMCSGLLLACRGP